MFSMGLTTGETIEAAISPKFSDMLTLSLSLSGEEKQFMPTTEALCHLRKYRGYAPDLNLNICNFVSSLWKSLIPSFIQGCRRSRGAHAPLPPPDFGK